jgi:hypothetical protein
MGRWRRVSDKASLGYDAGWEGYRSAAQFLIKNTRAGTRWTSTTHREHETGPTSHGVYALFRHRRSGRLRGHAGDNLSGQSTLLMLAEHATRPPRSGPQHAAFLR